MQKSNNIKNQADYNAGLLKAWQGKLDAASSKATLHPNQERRLFRRFSALHRELAAQPRKTRRQLTRKSRLQLIDIAFLLALGFSLPAEAVDILVDINIPDPVPDGSCSLIEAINNANADSLIHRDCPAGAGDDTIILQSGSTHTITKSINRRPDQGLTAITSRMTIEGNDSAINVSAVPVDIVFNIGPKGDLTLNDTTISGDAGSGSGTNGPRILNTGMLQLNNVSVLLNPETVAGVANRGTLAADNLLIDAPDGGYTNGHGILNDGDLTASNSRIQNLTFTYAYGDYGPVINRGNMRLENSSVTGNTALLSYDGAVAGIDNSGVFHGVGISINDNSYYSAVRSGIVNRTNGTLRLESSVISGNRALQWNASNRAGIANYGAAYLERVNIDSNDGGVFNYGHLSLVDSTVSHNSAPYYSGVINRGNGKMVLIGVTVANNIGAWYTEGGGVFNQGDMTITNSTIANNNYFDRYCNAASITNDGTLTVTATTIAGNGNCKEDASHLGVFNRAGGELSIYSSIVTGSFITTSDQTVTGRVLTNEGNILASEYNLFGDSSITSSVAFAGFTPGPTDIVATVDGADPTPLNEVIELESATWSQPYTQARLTDNGGPTETVALVDGGPAIDVFLTDCLPTDQRGTSRPQGSACDIGAYELEAGLAADSVISDTGIAVTNHAWTSVMSENMPARSVVILGPPGANGGDPGVVRLRNISTGGFDIRFQEWDYLDGLHTSEQVPYLVAQAGRHVLPNGVIWEVGTFYHYGTPNWKPQKFIEGFPGMPRLFLTVQTFNGGSAVTPRARNVTATGFDIGFFEQESLMDGHVGEKVGYLAVYDPSGAGAIEIHGVPVPYEVQQNNVSHSWTMVRDRLLKVEEEQSKDSETWHANEEVDVMALGESLFSQIVTSNGGDPAALRQKD